MSNYKEFEETKVKGEIYQKSFGYMLNFEERGIAQDAFSTAWDYQQKIIDKKDAEIERLKKSLKELIFHCEDYGIKEESLAILMAVETARKALSEVEG